MYDNIRNLHIIENLHKNENIQTGDLLLFDYYGYGISGWFSWLIKYFTNSNYTHIGMIVIDPEFTNPPLKGVYLWESGYNQHLDPEDHKCKFGVQLTPIQTVLNEYENKGKIFYRKLNCPNNTFNYEKLRRIHTIVHNKKYDTNPYDWFTTLLYYDTNPQKEDRFWCSALVGYIYTKLNILIPTTDWSILRPCDFSSDKENLNLLSTSHLEKQIQIL
jgi:hypothetical protein